MTNTEQKQKETAKEIVLILLDAAGLGKERGGLNTTEITELTNRVFSLFSQAISLHRENIIARLEKEKKSINQVTKLEHGSITTDMVELPEHEYYNDGLSTAISIVKEES